MKKKRMIYTPPQFRVVELQGKLQLLDGSRPNNPNDPENDW